MVLEVAQIRIRAGQSTAFEAAFHEAERLLPGLEGYLRHELQHCVEQPEQYLLFTYWRRIEDHLVGFRSSEHFQEWRRLLGPFYDGPATVLHYQPVPETHADR